jgi:signal transduction histidine kinase/CheY-like chemotaxis protein
LSEVLEEVARALGASGAGLAVPAQGTLPFQQQIWLDNVCPAPSLYPWQEQPDLLAQLRLAPSALPASNPDGPSWLLAPLAGDGVLWVVDARPRAWAVPETAVLALAADVLTRLACCTAAPWARSLEKAALQRRLEEVARMTGRLAHDFGNFITGILGFADLSLSQLPPDSLPYSYVKEVLQAAQRGTSWLQKLHLFSRRRVMQFAPAPLARVVAEEAERVRSAWGKDVTLEVELPPDVPAVAVEAEALRQLLAQLLANARDAIAGQGAVTLSARPAELSERDCQELLGGAAPGAYLELTVSDSGPGLSPEARCRLFREPFYSSKVRHLGLGLAVVYGILQTYRGALRLGPHPERGTAVRVYLPLAVQPARPAAAATGPAVLVVDDDALVARYIARILEDAGYRVQTAGGGQEALGRFGAAAVPFELVLCDVLMPQMNGFELARALQSRQPGVRILFLSGAPAPVLASRDENLRHCDLLTKPIRPDALLQAVRSTLQRPAGRPAPADPARAPT